MSKEIESLKLILKEKVLAFHKGLCPCYYAERREAVCVNSAQGMIVLREHEGAMLNKVTLTGISPNALVLKPENFGVRFYRKNFLNKSCDYLILDHDVHGTPHAVFIDLKTDIYDHPDGNNVFRANCERDAECGLQFCGADALFKLLMSVVEVYYKTATLSQYQRHYWILYKNALAGSTLTSDVDLTADISEVVRDFRKSKLRDRIYALKTQNNASIKLEDLI